MSSARQRSTANGTHTQEGQRSRLLIADDQPAILDALEILLRPEGYRDWVVIGPSSALHGASAEEGGARATGTPASRVYINPSGYREYVRTGKFPEGTLMIWESMRREPEAADRSCHDRAHRHHRRPDPPRHNGDRDRGPRSGQRQPGVSRFAGAGLAPAGARRYAHRCG